MKPVRKRTIIVLGVLAGIILSVPLSLAIIRWKSENRGVVLNHWRVSMRTGNFGSNYLLRAAVAVHSLGNPIPEEAMFFHGFFDNEGKKLNGRHRYRIRFKAGGLPPVDAFWSLTVYDRDGWLVPNQLDRYSLSDRSRGLVFNNDRSLDIIIQHEAPPGKLSNWLPTPKGEFTISLRTYLPKKELLELKWAIPPIERLDAAREGGE
ncbi:MAG: DUF1254 domain-containing protein [Spirochaetes bacterium]|nr:DUF1254 domain-containing protein [Spirochaetota bacterium]